jgi:hypothetical protein
MAGTANASTSDAVVACTVKFSAIFILLLINKRN